jgi:diguanylate cyclase (GGDEF)-like protein
MDFTLPPERLMAIIETQNEIAATGLELDAVMALVVKRAQALTGAAGAIIERVQGEALVPAVACGAGEPWLSVQVDATFSLSGMCVRLGQTLYCRDAESDRRVDLDAARMVGATSLVCVPLLHEDHVLGVLKVFSAQESAFEEEHVETLVMLSRMVAPQMAHASEFQRQASESRHDSLTGLANRRAFDERLGSEVARVRRHGGELALALLDLDSLREVNDMFGQAVGDEVLRGVAKHLSLVRGEDSAFRIGGDEFAIIFPETASDGASVGARRVAASVFADHGCGGIGISWGVAELTGGDPEQLLADATAELKRAKRSRSA